MSFERLLSWGLLAAAGCSGNQAGDAPKVGLDFDPPVQCIDLDGDGAGHGDACRSDDCDDTDPATVSECGQDCADRPLRAGCPCEAGLVVACYMGPEGSGGRGICEGGVKHCRQDGWGPCDKQVLPLAPDETACDFEDDDCDGVVDDGVQTDCGDCNDECFSRCVGVGCEEPFDPDAGRALVVEEDGSLTVSSTTAPTNFVIWIANSRDGTVSKVDTRERREVGRYRTVDPEICDDPSPSRTAVNPHGDVVVSNRHDLHGGSTKILASDCPDRNGNGVIQTSSGTSDVLPWGEDECIAWYVPDIPAARGTAFEVRSELDGGLREYVWVGSYPLVTMIGTIYEVDSQTGEKTGTVIHDTGAYGLAMAPGGLLWSVGLGGCPVATDTTTHEQAVYECPPGGGAYGLAVDAVGRVWIGSHTARLTPETGRWEVPVGARVWGGGITVDAAGNAYTGEWGDLGGGAYRIDGETMEATALPGMGGHGWAVDFDGYVWAVDMVDSAHVMDPETLEVEEVRPPFAGPYTYSDMTGFMLQNTLGPAGIYTERFDTCEAGEQPHLAAIAWDAEVPTGTSVSFRIRVADSLEALDEADWIGIGEVPPAESPLSLDPVLERGGIDPAHAGHLVDLEATLQSLDGVHQPVLSSFTLRYSCAAPFG